MSWNNTTQNYNQLAVFRALQIIAYSFFSRRRVKGAKTILIFTEEQAHITLLTDDMGCFWTLWAFATQSWWRPLRPVPHTIMLNVCCWHLHCSTVGLGFTLCSVTNHLPPFRSLNSTFGLFRSLYNPSATSALKAYRRSGFMCKGLLVEIQ